MTEACKVNMSLGEHEGAKSTKSGDLEGTCFFFSAKYG